VQKFNEDTVPKTVYLLVLLYYNITYTKFPDISLFNDYEEVREQKYLTKKAIIWNENTRQFWVLKEQTGNFKIS
jgi:hypothetical protein